MAIRRQWLVWCTTENTYVPTEVLVSDPNPTVCPNDGGHAVGDIHISASDLEFPTASDPTVLDDIDRGYEPGMKWINSATNMEYVCISSSVGAAVWSATTIPVGVGYASSFLDAVVATSNSNWTDAFAATSLTPPFDGDYFAIFEMEVTGSGKNIEVEIGIGKNSLTTVEVDTNRPRGADTKPGTVIVTTMLLGLITTDTIHGLFRKKAGNGSVSANKRRISIFRMG